MPVKITPDFLNPYFKKEKKHKAYAKTVELYNELKIHADGEKPGTLLTERRPSESDDIKAYREKIYVAITKSVVSKIISSLSKIRKSQDWSIRYDAETLSPKLREGERLQDYCEDNYPYFRSITTWLFEVCLKNYLIDPNALVCVMPLEVNIPDTDFLKPYSFIFNSPQVIDYVQDDYAIIYSTDKSTYQNGNEKLYDGDIFYVITSEVVQRWEQTKSDGTMELVLDYAHKMGKIPVFKVGGIFKEAMDISFIYESRISAIVPYLKEAVREYSDLQAEVVQHVHSTMWAYTSQECKACKGVGSVKKGENSIECAKCKGEGMKLFNPYSFLNVKAQPLNGPQVPVPPAGFIQKQVEIVKIQTERINSHKYDALAAINMEFLMQAPLNQSGKAKEVDRDESDNFVHANAEDLIAILDKIYFFSNEYRNRVAIPDRKERLAQLPSIAVPEKYMLISSSYLIDEMQKAKTAGVNPTTVMALEIEYAAKKFNTNAEIKKELELVFSLDPFPSLTDEQKMSRLQNKGITIQNYIISSNINQFVKLALFEVKNFATLDLSKQIDQMKKYADEIIKSNSAAAAVMEIVKDPPAKAAV